MASEYPLLPYVGINMIKRNLTHKHVAAVLVSCSPSAMRRVLWQDSDSASPKARLRVVVFRFPVLIGVLCPTINIGGRGSQGVKIRQAVQSCLLTMALWRVVHAKDKKKKKKKDKKKRSRGSSTRALRLIERIVPNDSRCCRTFSYLCSIQIWRHGVLVACVFCQRSRASF